MCWEVSSLLKKFFHVESSLSKKVSGWPLILAILLVISCKTWENVHLWQEVSPWKISSWLSFSNDFLSYEQQKHTVRNLHILSKNSTSISCENCRFFGWKNSWKCCGFGLFSYWQLWFHERNCQKKIGVKTPWKDWFFVQI